MNNNISKKSINLALSAMFAALVFLFTAYILHIPIGTGGYVHIGDAMIFLAASILPFGYAMGAAAVGATLSDIATGYAIWSPYTFFIKAIMALMLSNKGEKILTKRNCIMVFVASIINIVGYYFAEAIMVRNLISPLASILPGLFQFFGSLIFYFVLGFTLDKINFKKNIISKIG